MKADNTSPLSLHPLILAVALLSLCLHSCTPVREAQQIVATSDSLRTAGVQYTDSTAMADAATTLERVHLLYPTAYAHANYYYGRILREHNDHPAAMLAFLRVIHSRTHDYAIKGRSYSNIANMCRLAAEHKLAYDIYEFSAEEFLKAKDTTNYFYVTNSQAYECAEIGEKERAFHILQQIEKDCVDSNVLSRVLETKAEACYRVNQYDSALFYISQTYPPFSEETSNLLLRAQAHSCLNNNDSAIFYATRVFEHSPSWFEMNNAYYILANDDESKNKEEALQVAADRSDIQKLIEIRQGQLSQATQLLRQDLNRKPDLTWLVAIIATLLLMSAGITTYVIRRKRQHKLLSQQMDDIRQRKVLEVQQYCDQLQLSTTIKTDLSWSNYNHLCATMNRRMYGLADKLIELGLNESDIRLCVLVMTNKKQREIAEILNYSPKSIGKMKDITAQKMGVNGGQLRDRLLQIVCS